MEIVMLPNFMYLIFGFFQAWTFFVLYSQFFVFIFIDVLRNASTTLPRMILVCAIGCYIKTAFAEFEDKYRSLKEVVFNICKEYSDQATGNIV